MIKKKIIGEVLIDGNIKYVYLIDDSRLSDLGIIKIEYMDNEGREATKLVIQDTVKKY